MIPDLAVNRLAGTFILCLLATSALADVAAVASVIDGDTIDVHGQRIRLHGIDAPESRQLCRLDGKSWPCGKDAANALADKIARRPVTCEDLGAWMVLQGLALAYRRYSLDYVEEEADAQAARRGIWAGEFVKPWEWRRGERLETAAPKSCTACDLRHKRLLKRPEKCTIKGNINAKGERIYHVPGQQAYSVTRINPVNGERWFCSEAEASVSGWRKALQ